MVVSDVQVKNVLAGTVEHKFTQLGFSLLITRLAWAYKNNPSDSVLTDCTKEINSFLAKYESIIGKDYETFVK